MKYNEEIARYYYESGQISQRTYYDWRKNNRIPDKYDTERKKKNVNRRSKLYDSAICNCQDAMYRYAMYLTGNNPDFASEVMQETFYHLFLKQRITDKNVKESQKLVQTYAIRATKGIFVTLLRKKISCIVRPMETTEAHNIQLEFDLFYEFKYDTETEVNFLNELLTSNAQKVLKFKLQGFEQADIARKMFLSRSMICHYNKEIKQAFNKLDELYKQAA